MTPLDSRSLTWTAVWREVSRARGGVRWAWAATRDDDGAWRLAHVALRTSADVEETFLRYDGAAFGVESVSPRAAARRLRAGLVVPKAHLGSRLEFDVPQGSVYGNWLTTERDGVILHENPWPELFVPLSGNAVARPPAGPLQTSGQRLFPHWSAAVSELVFERPIEPFAVQRQPLGAIRLADARARFADLRVAPDSVAVSVESEMTTLAGWRVRAAWRAARGDARWRTLDDVALSDAGVTHLHVVGVPYEMVIVLVDDRDNITDRRGWEGGNVPRVEDESRLLARVERWRHEGEGAEVEFKQALDKDRTRERFAASVAAFANTGGGVVLVGIDDEGGIVGYDRPKAGDQLTAMITNAIDEPPATRIVRAVVDGAPVWVVQVAASPWHVRPHAVGGRVLVRAHATNRPATAREIRTMTAQPEQAPEAAWRLS